MPPAGPVLATWRGWFLRLGGLDTAGCHGGEDVVILGLVLQVRPAYSVQCSAV